MKSVCCHASDQPLAVEDRTCPQPGQGEVLLTIERCGICGSELHMPEGPRREFPGGMVMGHEYAGRIAALGSGVTALAVGDLVALYPASGCGNCHACMRGNEILCRDARRLLGGFAEMAVIPARCAFPLPDAMSAADGALVEPLAVSFYGVKQAALGKSDRVLVLGAGSIALGAIFWARRAGVKRIVAMSRSSRRADLALELGADSFLTYSGNDGEEVIELLGGAPDVVFECAGVPGLLAKACAHAGAFGRVVSLGLGHAADPIMPLMAGMKDLTIRFPVGYTRDDFREVIATMLDGPVDPKRMISRVVSLDELPDAFAHLLGPNAETKVQVAPRVKV